MSMILENQTLEMKNVLSRRAKFTQSDIEAEMMKIDALLKETGAVKTGSIVTVTYEIDDYGMMDIEILVQLNKAISMTNLPNGNDYTLKPVFRLINAVMIRHTGDPELLPQSMDELNVYIEKNSLTPISAAYNVMVYEPKDLQDIKNTVVEIYVGISPNIL